MSLDNKLKATVARMLFDPRVVKSKRRLAETRRKLSGKSHVISVFLQLDDPYSYLLSRFLPSLEEHFDIELKLYLSEALGDEFRPEAALAAEYAVVDCARLAAELGIPFLDKGELPPTEHRGALTDALAARAESDAFPAEFYRALEVFWRGDVASAAELGRAGSNPESTRALLRRSREQLEKLSHYASAMLHYGGEWYWGIDRLNYLVERLRELGVAREKSLPAALDVLRQLTDVGLPVTPPGVAKELPPIEMFFSFRSPYSYLGLCRVSEIAAAFGIELKLRAVLPMVMRGLVVPQKKLNYIIADVSREAARRKIAFGKFADPLGAGVERCLAVYQYAESEHRGVEFALSTTAGIWAEGIDVASDAGMREVAGRAGLFWPEVEKAMQSDDWREQVELNQEELQDSGLWGVPTVRTGDFIAWGQDRDWLLVRHLEDLCDTGDGIIV